MAYKDLSHALNDFVNVLVEQELEPIRLDLIRIENDFSEAISNIQETLKKLTSAASAPSETAPPSPSPVSAASAVLANFDATGINDEKFDMLKEAIEKLAIDAADALAEGFSEQETQYTELFENLNDKIFQINEKVSRLENALEANANA